MSKNRVALVLGLGVAAVATLIASCASPGGAPGSAAHPAGARTEGVGAIAPGTQAWQDRVMTSAFCGTCHPDLYDEHQMNTHGRAFTDPEVRMATGNFETGDCIRCHTPRPIFETGNGMNPQRRFYGLEEGNSCMTCHWKEGVDYSRFQGGPDCKTAFDPRVGEVEACAACHRNHGTPYQWEKSPNGKEAGRTCVTCHMKQVERPIAVGGPVRKVHSHVFPGARNDAHVRKAYDYSAKIDGNEAVVTITNSGAGHNFPTELRQRSLESLIVVRDHEGKEVARSRRVYRDPYRRPYGLTLPTNKQIPSGESREHRVPLLVAGGTVDCELHYKLYFPIEDNHPDLARRLEMRRLAFEGIAPSDKPVESDPETDVATPEGIDPRLAGPADLGEMANPKIAAVKFDVPTGSTPEDIKKLIDLFNFQIPQANRAAVQQLVKIGMPAVPDLIEALGSWDNKTFNQAGQVLGKIGAPAVPAVRAAIRHDNLFVRMHSRRLLEMMPVPTDKAVLIQEVLAGLRMPNALDRRSSLDLLATLGAFDAVPQIRAALGDFDPDIVRSAAFALAALDSRDSVPAIEAALARQTFDETRIDLAWALARLGATSGIPVLLAGLDHRDDLIRENCFEKFFMVTRQHLGYEVMAPHDERLAALARLQVWWTTTGSPELLQKPYFPSPEHDDHALHTVLAIGGGAGIVPAAANEDKALQELVDMGQDAIPALIKGLKFPPGFAQKRASVLSIMSRIGDRQAAPFVAAALRDPVFGVAQWAAAALERVGDKECIPALRRFQARVAWAAAAGQLPKSFPSPDPLLATAARTRLLLGDDSARDDLVELLFSQDQAARQTAITALAEKFGDDKGFKADAEPAERRKAAARWTE